MVRLAAVIEGGALGRLVDGAGRTLGVVDERSNPLAEPAASWAGERASAAGRGGLILAWSGRPETAPGAEGALFARDPSAWLPGAAEALSAWLDAARPTLEETGARLVLRPHARHVLGDAHRARTYIGGLSDDVRRAVGVALDVAALFEPEMLGEAAVHAERSFELLGSMAEIIVLSDPGGLGPDLLGELCRAHAVRPAVGGAGERAAGDREQAKPVVVLPGLDAVQLTAAGAELGIVDGSHG